MGAVSLFELKDYYLRNKSRLLTDFEVTSSLVSFSKTWPIRDQCNFKLQLKKFPQVTESPTSYGQNTNLWQKNKCRKIIPCECN